MTPEQMQRLMEAQAAAQRQREQLASVRRLISEGSLTAEEAEAEAPDGWSASRWRAALRRFLRGDGPEL